ncbi:hypothetical protein K1719_021313 [Acacia pycnantha]|nr:hypothetical protein K1719_021313 [Acacia pycnantha]
MDTGSVHHFFKQKTILVTGATGFLAKVFVEKLLRIQSDVRKVYLLIRASDDNAATKRFRDELDHRKGFVQAAIAGDVSVGNLGLNDSNLDKLSEEIQVIVNSAAITKFDERFDILMNVNTMGALNVLNFANRCRKIQVLLHVSTAYVCGEAKDKKVIREEPFKMGQALKKVTELDIHAEVDFMKNRLQQLQEKKAGEKVISDAIKDYGLKRANLYGWPNTYVFTKAMGGMLLSHHKDHIPLVIVRPTMLTSTYKEPFPGWIEGLRTVDAVIGGYGKGKLTYFPGNPKTILDLMPADMVINCMMAAMANHSNEAASENYIYHVGSSSKNPFWLGSLPNILHLYFKNNPSLTTKNGKPVMIRSKGKLASNARFHMYLFLQYFLPLMGLNLANKVLCGGFQDVYNGGHRKTKLVIRMAELYKPCVFFKATFDDTNTEKLRMATKWESVESIDWSDYMMNVR